MKRKTYVPREVLAVLVELRHERKNSSNKQFTAKSSRASVKMARQKEAKGEGAQGQGQGQEGRQGGAPEACEQGEPC